MVRRWASPCCFPSEPPDAYLLGKLPVWTSHRVPPRRPCPVSHAPSVQLDTERGGSSRSPVDHDVCPASHTPGRRPGTRFTSSVRVAMVSSVHLPGPGTPDRWLDFVSGWVRPAFPGEISTRPSEPRTAAGRPQGGGTVPTARAGRRPSLPSPPPLAPAVGNPRPCLRPDLHRPLPGSQAFCRRPSWASSLHTAKGRPLGLRDHVSPFL